MFILASRKSTRLCASAAKRTNGDCEPFLPRAVIDPLPDPRLSYFVFGEERISFFSYTLDT